jgi:hypothetical protein
MSPLQFPVGLGLLLALGAGSGVWTAKLDGKDGSKISGTAQVESVPVMPPSDSAIPPRDTIPPAAPTAGRQASPEELRVTVTLSNAPANASLSWYLYSGSCNASSAGDAETILGLPSSYRPVKVDGSGNGSTTVAVRGAQVGIGGSYYVGVLAAGKLAACGNLEATKTSTGQA